MRSRYVVWGYGRSWIVHQVGADGRIVWASEWMPSRDAAGQELERIEEKQRREKAQ